jgi:hypothetical protein
MNDDIAQKLEDQAALIRKMDAIANAERSTQTHEATAALLERAAKVIRLYRARKDIDDNPPYGSAFNAAQKLR